MIVSTRVAMEVKNNNAINKNRNRRAESGAPITVTVFLTSILQPSTPTVNNSIISSCCLVYVTQCNYFLLPRTEQTVKIPKIPKILFRAIREQSDINLADFSLLINVKNG